jgi:hypothetical protein
MQQTEIFLLFTQPLERAGFEYMATGSVASMIFGTPRFTNDLDIVLVISPDRVTEFASLFPLSDFYCPPVEVLTIESRRRTRGHFNLIHHETGYKSDVYVCRKDDLHPWAFRNKKRISWDKDKNIWIAPPEYVIIEKLIYFREGGAEKHILDIQGMIAVSGDILDRDTLKTWIEKLGLTRQWSLV